MSDGGYTSEDSLDYHFEFRQKGLYVTEPTYLIDMDKKPIDGNEHVIQCRLEAKRISRNKRLVALREEEHERLKQKAKEAAIKFSLYALQQAPDYLLKKKFPRKLVFPKNDFKGIQDWCTFCLGSKLCGKIYSGYKEPSEEIEGHLPLLSIIVHFDEYTTFTVIKHLHEWFQSIGMEESIAVWMYAVLGRMRKPLDPMSKERMEAISTHCKNRLIHCDELEAPRLILISEILSVNFSVSSKKYL